MGKRNEKERKEKENVTAFGKNRRVLKCGEQ